MGWTFSRAIPILDGRSEIIEWFGAASDITERKRLEGLRDQFVSAVTHELRTPLVSLTGYSTYSRSLNRDCSNEKCRHGWDVVKEQADRLLRITDDLLDYRRLSSGKFQLDLKAMDLRNVVDRCAEEIKSFSTVRKQRLAVEVPDGPFIVNGDKTRLEQVLMNLLINASKFSPEASELKLSMRKENGSCRVSVTDSGIGIRKEDLEHVFEPFAAVQKPNYIKGTGLGLSVTKALVNAHGGRIWAESEGEDKGSTFAFTIPLHTTESIAT